MPDPRLKKTKKGRNQPEDLKVGGEGGVAEGWRETPGTRTAGASPAGPTGLGRLAAVDRVVRGVVRLVLALRGRRLVGVEGRAGQAEAGLLGWAAIGES